MTQTIVGWSKPYWTDNDRGIVRNEIKPYAWGVKFGSETRDAISIEGDFRDPRLITLHDKFLSDCYVDSIPAALDNKYCEAAGALERVLHNVAYHRAQLITIDSNMSAAAITLVLEACHAMGCKVLMVTVKSDMSDTDCTRVFGTNARQSAVRLTEAAQMLGVDGVVAPCTLVPVLRNEGLLDEGMITMCAGMRWKGDDPGRHVWHFTPELAAENQVTYAVGDHAVWNAPRFPRPKLAMEELHNIFRK